MRCALICLACGTMAFSCAREPDVYRGPGLDVAALPPDDIVGVYRATLGAAFNLGDRDLSLLLDPMLLPRGEGLGGGDTMPSAIRSLMQRDGLVKGT